MKQTIRVAINIRKLKETRLTGLTLASLSMLYV